MNKSTSFTLIVMYTFRITKSVRILTSDNFQVYVQNLMDYYIKLCKLSQHLLFIVALWYLLLITSRKTKANEETKAKNTDLMYVLLQGSIMRADSDTTMKETI